MSPLKRPALKLVPEGCCPTCGRPYPIASRRICGLCKKPIIRGHKFVFVGSTVQHRICERPDSYTIEVA